MVPEYWPDCRMSSEFRIQKLSYRSSFPALGVSKRCVQGEVPFIKTGCFERRGLRAVDGEVEDSYIEELDFVCVVHYKIEGMLRLKACFCRCAEEEIDVGCDTGLL